MLGFFGVFSVIPYEMTLDSNLERDIVARIRWTGLLLQAGCVQLVLLPSRGDTVTARPGLRRCPLFSYILFLSADGGVELERAGPATKVAGLFDKLFSLFVHF